MEPQIKLFKFYSPTPCVYSCKCATMNMGKSEYNFSLIMSIPRIKLRLSDSAENIFTWQVISTASPKHSGVRGRGIKSLRSVKHNTIHGSTWHGDIGGLVVKDHLKLFETSFGYLRPCPPPLPHPKKRKRERDWGHLGLHRETLSQNAKEKARKKQMRNGSGRI